VSFPDLPGDRRRRTWVLVGLVLAVIAALAARLIYLQIVRGPYYADLAQRNLIRPDPLPAPRGRILDRQGRRLADNIITHKLSLEVAHPAYRDPQVLGHACEEIATLLGIDPVALTQRAVRSRRYFAPITLGQDPDPQVLASLIERTEPIPGLRIESVPQRYYPCGTLAAHLLGYLGEVTDEELGDGTYRAGSRIGRAGVERQYEELLRGVDGETYVTVDAVGRKTDLFPGLPPRAPVAGADLTVTIDSLLQATAEQALQQVRVPGREDRAPNGAVVALDPWTGEILVCASAPGFDPNAFSHGLSDAEWAQLQGTDRPLLDRAVQAGYPPGSIFKIVTTLAGCDRIGLSRATGYDPCAGSYRYGNRVFRCWKAGGHGRLLLRDAFARSCDVYFYQLGRQLGLERLLSYAATLHADAPTGIDLPEERSGLVPTMDWYRQHLRAEPPQGSVLNLAIGQGELVLTPMEIASLVGALVSDGVVRRPHVGLRARTREGVTLWERSAPEPVRELNVPARDRALLRELLEAVVMDGGGTGSRARVEGFAIGGKTGTAQNPQGRDHALFVGVAPIDAPRLVVVAVLEESGHGGTVAAPVVQQVMQVLLKGREKKGPQEAPGEKVPKPAEVSLREAEAEGD
jgi:penicillin-binding protein 2